MAPGWRPCCSFLGTSRSRYRRQLSAGHGRLLPPYHCLFPAHEALDNQRHLRVGRPVHGQNLGGEIATGIPLSAWLRICKSDNSGKFHPLPSHRQKRFDRLLMPLHKLLDYRKRLRIESPQLSTLGAEGDVFINWLIAPLPASIL